MGDPYRVPGERNEDKIMDERTYIITIMRYAFFAIVALICAGSATIAYDSHESCRAKVEEAAHRMEAAKADRDRVMFEAMGKNPPPAASRSTAAEEKP